MCTYNERLRRGFNTYLAAHGDDMPPEFSHEDLREITPPPPKIPDDRVSILPIVVFVLSEEQYAALCEGDEN